MSKRWRLQNTCSKGLPSPTQTTSALLARISETTCASSLRLKYPCRRPAILISGYNDFKFSAAFRFTSSVPPSKKKESPFSTAASAATKIKSVVAVRSGIFFLPKILEIKIMNCPSAWTISAPSIASLYSSFLAYSDIACPFVSNTSFGIFFEYEKSLIFLQSLIIS